VLAEASAAGAAPTNLDVELMATALPPGEGAATHGGRGATLAVDAPRRAVWARGEPFVLLDCDMIALQNPDALLDALGAPAPDGDVLAVPAFRLKRRAFGSARAGGGFNAGVLVVRAPSATDADALAALVARARTDDTEESLLNELFAGRWAELPRGFNVVKRVRAHAPALWAELVARREIVFLHFIGAKPWMHDAAARAGADWEAERAEYAGLERAWARVRAGAGAGPDGTLLALLDDV
jgi:lipopolysaccharide biosynthesis glycosyltransferase